MGTKGIKVIIAFICATLMLTACNKDDIDYIIRHNEDKVSINEGVAGTVYERYGDWMPCAGCSNPNRGERAIVREVYVYEYTRIADLDSATRYDYSDLIPIDRMPKRLVGSTVSDEEGFYEIALPAGNYSIFLIENGRVYWVGGDSYGGMEPVTVKAGEVTLRNVLLDHAVY